MNSIQGFCLQYPCDKQLLEPLLNAVDFTFCLSVDHLDQMQLTNLLPLTNSKNYLTINSQPVLLVGSTTVHQIPNLFLIDLLTTDKDDQVAHLNATESNPYYIKCKYPIYVSDHKTHQRLDYCKLCHAMINQTIPYVNYFREIFTGFDTTQSSANIGERLVRTCHQNKMICHQMTPKSVYCALKGQIENIIERPNPNGVDNLLFIHSWNDQDTHMAIESDPQILKSIRNLVSHYHNPQKYNQIPDLIL
jgi:hypothetical protein